MSSPVLAITVSSSPSRSCNPAASFAPPVPPASTTTDTRPRPAPGIAVGEARDLQPGVCLVTAVDRDQHRRQLLDDPGDLQRPGVHSPQAGNPLDQRGHPRLVGLAVAADEHVLVHLVREVIQRRRAHGVQGGDHGDALGHHLLSLLCRRALPDAKRTRRLAADRGGQRDGAVDEQLARLECFAQVR